MTPAQSCDDDAGRGKVRHRDVLWHYRCFHFHRMQRLAEGSQSYRRDVVALSDCSFKVRMVATRPPRSARSVPWIATMQIGLDTLLTLTVDIEAMLGLLCCFLVQNTTSASPSGALLLCCAPAHIALFGMYGKVPPDRDRSCQAVLFISFAVTCAARVFGRRSVTARTIRRRACSGSPPADAVPGRQKSASCRLRHRHAMLGSPLRVLARRNDSRFALADDSLLAPMARSSCCTRRSAPYCHRRIEVFQRLADDTEIRSADLHDRGRVPFMAIATERDETRQKTICRASMALADVFFDRSNNPAQAPYSFACSPRTKSDSPGWRSRLRRSAARIARTSAKAWSRSRLTMT